MARKGGRRHLKRHPSPSFWPIHRKEEVWTVRPSAGPHPIQGSLPLLLILRDILHQTQTAREARRILAQRRVFLDGRPCTSEKTPVGVMDVIDIPLLTQTFRVLPSEHKKFKLAPVSKEDKSSKLCRIENKRVIRGGAIQLNLHDGKNLLIKPAEGGDSTSGKYKPMDVVKINLKDNTILSHLKFKEGAYSFIIGGKNIGKHGRIEALSKGASHRETAVKIKTPQQESFTTIAPYIFVVGEEKPLIPIPEETTDVVA